MAPQKSFLLTLLLCLLFADELLRVTCQEDQSNQCIPKSAFLALLRLRQVSSNLAAYSRVIQNAKDRDDMAHLKALTEEGDDTEVCIPAGIYLELFKDPALRGHLSVIGRTQKLPDFPGRLLEDTEQTGSRTLDSQKRSIATLAKNDDLPISFQGREDNDDDGEKRSVAASEHIDTVLKRLLNEEARRSASAIHEYVLPNDEINWVPLTPDYSFKKRNVGSLARDSALPVGRRNIASLARDYALPNGKRNVGALARDWMLPVSGRQNGKRINSMARDYELPGYFDVYDDDRRSAVSFDTKRSLASLARNSDLPTSGKRGVSIPASIILKTLNRHGRSLHDTLNEESLHEDFSDNKSAKGERSPRYRLNTGEKRVRRQVDYTDEYPLPVMQNTNALDYEEVLGALASQYPNMEKRFMGSAEETHPLVADQFDRFRPSKRHIGALAKLGWLPSGFRSTRFSRSPRYSRTELPWENPADGTQADDPSDTSSWPLNLNRKSPLRPTVRALQGDCRHGFIRYLYSPPPNSIAPPTVFHYRPQLNAMTFS